MTLIRLSVEIAATPEGVYDYVTRPARWKEWHPSSLRTRGIGDESLTAGRHFEEDVRSAGFTRHLSWRVEESEQAVQWRAAARMEDGSSVKLHYGFTATPGGMRFTRTLEYSLRPVALRWLNDLIVWRKVKSESARALDNVRRRLSR